MNCFTMPTTTMHSLCTFLPWPFHCSCCLHMHFNCASNAHALEIHKVKYIFYCSASVSSKSLLPYWCISLPYWKYSTKTDATFVYIYLHLTVQTHLLVNCSTIIWLPCIIYIHVIFYGSPQMLKVREFHCLICIIFYQMMIIWLPCIIYIHVIFYGSPQMLEVREFHCLICIIFC